MAVVELDSVRSLRTKSRELFCLRSRSTSAGGCEGAASFCDPADLVTRVGGGVGDRLGGVITALSGECGPEVDSARGRVIEGCVLLTGMAALHKKKTEMLLG